MNDLISRQAAIDALIELYEYQRDIDPTEAADLVRQGIYLAEKKIEQLPSAKPEIIRCKDCKHKPTLDEDNEPEFPTSRCPCQCEDFYYSWMPKDDWFCANAERREE